MGESPSARSLNQHFFPTDNSMNRQNIAVVKQVLIEAAEVPHFFRRSDLHRLKWMIVQAYELGKRAKTRRERQARSERSHAVPVEFMVQLRRNAASQVNHRNIA